MFSLINSFSEDIKINYIYAEKRKTHPSYQGPRFYRLLGNTLAAFLYKKYLSTPEIDKIIFIFDKALSNSEMDSFYKELKPKLKELGKPYIVYFHSTMAHNNSQIADYASWAKYVQLERGETRPLESISSLEKEEFDIFKTGDKYYY